MRKNAEGTTAAIRLKIIFSPFDSKVNAPVTAFCEFANAADLAIG